MMREPLIILPHTHVAMWSVAYFSSHGVRYNACLGVYDDICVIDGSSWIDKFYTSCHPIAILLFYPNFEPAIWASPHQWSWPFSWTVLFYLKLFLKFLSLFVRTRCIINMIFFFCVWQFLYSRTNSSKTNPIQIQKKANTYLFFNSNNPILLFSVGYQVG